MESNLSESSLEDLQIAWWILASSLWNFVSKCDILTDSLHRFFLSLSVKFNGKIHSTRPFALTKWVGNMVLMLTYNTLNFKLIRVLTSNGKYNFVLTSGGLLALHAQAKRHYTAESMD